jgi:hypothetical protein
VIDLAGYELGNILPEILRKIEAGVRIEKIQFKRKLRG